MSDIEAIQQVLLRYSTAIDRRDWDTFRTCFTDDAQSDYGDIGRWSSAEEITAFMAAAHGGFGPTNHMLSNMVIELDGDRATATTYVHAVLTAGHDPEAWFDSVGTYEDTLVRTADGWRIAARTFRMTRMLASD
jgi:3-phenylpropionate/cinnamic acid dioxygenase small subunit